MSKEMSQNTTDWFPSACRAARAWLGWSAGDLASRLGITQRQVQRIEAGENQSDRRREKIAAVFLEAGISISPQGLDVSAPPSLLHPAGGVEGE